MRSPSSPTIAPCETRYGVVSMRRRATVGRPDTLLDEATRRGWVVVSMKRDWRVLFPPARR
jgi:hypothetical protein